MGKYLSNMNLGGHRRGTVRDYDDNDPVLVRRLEAGFVTRVGDSNPLPEVEGSVESEPEVVSEPVKKRAPKKRAPVAEELDAAFGSTDVDSGDEASVEPTTEQTAWLTRSDSDEDN